MAITLVSTPAAYIATSPVIISRWLATESPNNFRLQRKDYLVASHSNVGGALQLSLTTPYTGTVGNSISVYDAATGTTFTGTVDSIASPATSIVTSIVAVQCTDPQFANDNTGRAGYYFEGALTVNGVLQELTIIASPDSTGIADLDVSGILRIATSLGKDGDYAALLAAETSKSGSFTLKYRECWYGASGSYTAEGNTWYYAEAVRSVEQGSNLHEYVPSAVADAPFLNSFAQPVYFLGFPFDISFILPRAGTSPEAELTITINRYNASNTLLGTTSTSIDPAALAGRVVSLSLTPADIEAGADHITVEIAAA